MIKANKVAIAFILLIILSPLSIVILKQVASNSPNSVFLLVGFTPIFLALLLVAIIRIRCYYLGFKDNKTEWTETVSAISIFLLDDTGVDIPTPFKEYLKQDKLDYSLESLKIVDDYLEKARKDPRLKTLTDEEFTKIILRCGAYCGEVIRRNVKGTKMIWITYDKAVEWSPDIKNFGKSPLTFYILYEPFQDAFSFPMAKVQKYLEFGKSDSLYFLALSAIKRYSR